MATMIAYEIYTSYGCTWFVFTEEAAKAACLADPGATYKMVVVSTSH